MKCLFLLILVFKIVILIGCSLAEAEETIENCEYQTKDDSLLQCLTLGQEKYIIRKCETGAQNYENGTKLAFHCLEGSHLDGNLLYQCLNGKWDIAEEPKCQKTCPELIYNPVKTNVTCNSNNSCYERQIIGTTVQISCFSEYERPKTVKYTSIECLPNATWSNPIYDCIRVVVDVKNVLPLNTGGIETQINKVPYHAGVFIKKSTKTFQSCGATIISQRVVISAAHCFSNWGQTKYLIVAGKFHRNYKTIDPNQQESVVSEIFIHDSYKNQDKFRDDLAIVIVETPFMFTPVVQKVSVDLDFNDFTSGRVSGWGKDEDQKVLQTLHTVDLDIVSCGQESLPEKFCAGGHGQSVCQGDSGGGFVVERNGLKYVVGVVSTAQDRIITECTADNPAQFNRISPYLNLFQKAKRYLLLFQTCEDYKFKCNSGKCINYNQICDGMVDCDQDGSDDDELKTNCNLFPIQKMLTLGSDLLVASKFYENRYPNWVVPTGGLWIMGNFLSQVVTNDTIQKRLAHDFGVSVIDKGDDLLQNIRNASIYQSQFLYTRGEIDVVNDTLTKKYFGDVKARRKGPPEFFYPELFRVGIHLNADYSYRVQQRPVNITFVTTNNESFETPMFCFGNKKSQMTFIKALNADVASMSLGNDKLLYIVVPKSNMDITLQALKAYNMKTIEEKLFGNTKDICLPEFKIITSVDYSPVLYKLGYDYIFNLDPVELNIINKPVHFQSNIRGFFGVSEDENYQRPSVTNVVNTEQSFIVNKPFIFIVTEEITKSILFMGKVLEPQKYSRYANAYAKCKIFSEKQCN